MLWFRGVLLALHVRGYRFKSCFIYWFLLIYITTLCDCLCCFLATEERITGLFVVIHFFFWFVYFFYCFCVSCVVFCFVFISSTNSIHWVLSDCFQTIVQYLWFPTILCVWFIIGENKKWHLMEWITCLKCINLISFFSEKLVYSLYMCLIISKSYLN